MRFFQLVCFVGSAALFAVKPLWSQVTVFHTKPYDMLYSTSFSPDSRHVAYSGTWYVRIYDMKGKMVGEYFDRAPFISFRSDFRFWNIHRQSGSQIAFINNEELAVAEKNNGKNQKIKIIGVDGYFKREIKVPMDQLPDESYSNIDQIIVSPLMDRLITIERWTGDFVIRDMNFKVIRRVNLLGTNSYSNRFVNIEEIKFLPDGSGFILKSRGEPLQEGWIAFLTLYDKEGNFIRKLVSDEWVKTIETTYGKIEREKDSYPLNELDISPDGQTVVCTDCVGEIDRNLLGKYKYEEIHPPGSFSEHSYRVAKCIRTIDIKSGKQFQAYVLRGGDVTIKNAKERLPFTNPSISQIFFAPNSKDYIGVSAEGLYKISSDGKILEYLPYQNDDEYAAYYNKVYSKPLGYYSIKPQNLYITADRKTFVSKTIYTSLYFLNTEGAIQGQIKRYYTPFSTGTEGSPIRVSLAGRYFTLDIDQGKESLLWDFKTNTITKEKSSIYWDTSDNEYRMSFDKKGIRIKYRDSDALIPVSHIGSVVPFANRKTAVSDNGLVVVDQEGNPIIKHPKSTYWFRFAMHPGLEHYMVPSVDAKVKTMVKVSITGQKISDYWIGSFISKVLYSPDGSLLLGSHDLSGCISIWDNSNKLLDFPGQTKGHFNEGRFFDLHPDPVMSMAVTKDNRFLFTGTADRIIVTDLKTGSRATISLFYREHYSSTSENVPLDFIVSDSRGRFECSHEARDRVSIMENGTNQTDALWKKYYTQNLLWNYLQGL